MFGRTSKICELQKKVCNYKRALGDLFLLTKDRGHHFMEYDDESGLIFFLFRGIQKLHEEIADLNTRLEEALTVKESKSNKRG